MNEWINEKLLPPVLKIRQYQSNYCLTERDAFTRCLLPLLVPCFFY